MLAGLSSIPKEPIEAAQILGASRWRMFCEVQLPLLRPVIFLALVLRFLEAMAEFPKIWALFQGGPGTATETIPVYIFLTTWQYFQVSKGAALSYVAMMLMIVIVLLAIKLLRREKHASTRCTCRRSRRDDQDAAPPRQVGHPLRDPRRVGADRVLPDLLDDRDVVQDRRPVVRLAAGVLSRPADACELHERLVRRAGIRPDPVHPVAAEAADCAAQLDRRLVHVDVSRGRLRRRDRLRRVAPPHPVGGADVPAPDAAHDPADRVRRAAVALLFGDRAP